MELSRKQFKRVVPLLPKQRSRVKIENPAFTNALIYICEKSVKMGANGGPSPKSSVPSASISMRFNRRAENGVLERIVDALQAERLLDLKVFSLDSTSIKVHPDARGL
jgi:hypothetical protein